MSIDITITQTALRKKALPLEILLGPDLRYGALERDRLTPGELGEAFFVAYLPDCIGRGFQVFWKKGEKEKVELRALTPTTREELRAFYDCVARICAFWKCKLEVEGTVTPPEEFQAGFEGAASFHLRTLQSMAGQILRGESNTLTLHCAMFPVTLGLPEAERFAGAESTDAFRDFLHSVQCQDVYYASPMLYQDEQGIFGLLVVGEGVRTVLPTPPRVPLGYSVGQVDRWLAALCSDLSDGPIGQVPYETLLERLPPKKTSRFDGGALLVEGLTLKELRKIAQ